MTKALIADMAAVLIEAVKAGESLVDADRILRVARFGTGAIVAFRNAATALARVVIVGAGPVFVVIPGTALAADISTGGAVTIGFCLTGIGICFGIILAVHGNRRVEKRREQARREAVYKSEDHAMRAEALHLSDLQSLGRAVFARFLNAGGNLESWHYVIDIEAGLHGLKYRDGMRMLDGRKRTSLAQ